MRKTSVVYGGLVFAALSTQAFALEIGIEAVNLEPGNQDVVIGTNVTPPYPSGTNQVMEPDAGLGLRLILGGTNWRVSWLDASFETDFTGNGAEAAALENPDFNYGGYATVTASSDIKLSVIGADYLAPLTSSGGSRVNLVVGLRQVSYDNDIRADYDLGSQIVTRSTSSDLFGLRGGMDIGFSFFDSFSLDASFGMGLATGTSKFAQTESFASQSSNLESSTVAPMFDADIRLTYRFLKHAKVWLGYELLQFQGIATQQILTDDANVAAQIEEEIDAGFSGFKLGTAWTF